MRKLKVLLFAAAFLTGVASASTAGTLTLSSGVMGLSIGALPPITIGASSAPTVFVSSGSGSFTEPASVFGPANIALPRALFTGVPQISGLTLVNFANGSKVFNGTNGSAVGGLQGSAFVNVLGLLNLSIPLSPVGAGGTTYVLAGGITITVQGQLWTTGPAVVTGITTNTPGTAAVNTVTVTGSDARTPAHGGMMTLVSAFKAITNVAGNLPGLAFQTLVFSPTVPEPGTLLLLGSGVVGLTILGRRRMRK